MIDAFFKFGLVGLLGMIIDYGATFFFKESCRFQKYVANSIGFICAASSNYFLNRSWTFHSLNPEIYSEFSHFFVVSLVGLVVNNGFLYVFEQKIFLARKVSYIFKIGISDRQSFYFSKMLAIMITVVWNFLGNYYFTFQQ